MIIELYIPIFIIMIGFFTTAYIIKQELFWFLTMLFSSILILNNNIIIKTGQELALYNNPYILGINMTIFLLALILGILDLYDKYSLPSKM